MDFNQSDSVPANMFYGKPCRRCGSKLRYRASNRCVPCKSQLGFKERERAGDNWSARLRQYNRELKEGLRVRSPHQVDYEAAYPNRIAHNNNYQRQHPERLKVYKQNSRHKRRAVEHEPWTPAEWSERCDQFGNACAYCGNTGALTVDHVVALAAGGSHTLSNVVPACSQCNRSKRDSDLMSWYTAQDFFCPHRFRVIMRSHRCKNS